MRRSSGFLDRTAGLVVVLAVAGLVVGENTGAAVALVTDTSPARGPVWYSTRR